ncbi:trypsin-like serine protease [bacterium]|nr:MAG: trypsin-like serine protease [bacterium]
MRRLVLFSFTCVASLCHAVVATTSKDSPLGGDTSWSFVGTMSGASAVAIGPRTVLTAGHVAAGDFTLDGQSYRFTSTEMAPAVKRKPVDLRIVQLEDTLPGWYEVAKSVGTKNTVTMVGFGQTGVVNTRSSGYELIGGSMVRRAGKNLITSKKSTDRGPSLIAMLDGAGEAALAGGDSGGGWFVNGKLVGVSGFTYTKNSRKASYGFAKKAYFGSGAIDLTNSSIQKWLRAATSRGLPPPESGHPQAVPEPASLLALAVGGVILTRGRKR